MFLPASHSLRKQPHIALGCSERTSIIDRGPCKVLTSTESMSVCPSSPGLVSPWYKALVASEGEGWTDGWQYQN